MNASELLRAKICFESLNCRVQLFFGNFGAFLIATSRQFICALNQHGETLAHHERAAANAKICLNVVILHRVNYGYQNAN